MRGAILFSGLCSGLLLAGSPAVAFAAAGRFDDADRALAGLRLAAAALGPEAPFTAAEPRSLVEFPLSVPQAAPAPEKNAAAKDGGRFLLKILPAKRPENRRVEAVFRKTGVFERAVAQLNTVFDLPRDITVSVRECRDSEGLGSMDAWYDSEEHSITYCYGLAANTARLFREHHPPKGKFKLEDILVGDALHVLLHETGHALIDVYQLPAVGREEDAVDQLATLSLLRRSKYDRAPEIEALQFLYSSRENSDYASAFSDEHSLDIQRYYDTLCLIYGSDPDRQKRLIGKGGLPKDRAENCPDEYEKINRAWSALLKPHLKVDQELPLAPEKRLPETR